MGRTNVAGALFGGGVGLLLLYAAAWAVWVMVDAPSEELLEMAPEDGDGASGVAYEVITGDGSREVLIVPVDDPGAVLLTANERFGDVSSVKRLGERETKRAVAEQQRRDYHLWMAALFLFPIGMFWAGTQVRRDERAMSLVWEALRPTLSADINTLSHASGLDGPGIVDQIERINRRGMAQLGIHQAVGWVADIRLGNHGITVSFCPHCNEPAAVRVRADLVQVPQCPACMSVYPRDQLAKQTRDLVESLVASPPPPPEGAPPRFSGWLFTLLTLLFPPLAIWHGMRAAG